MPSSSLLGFAVVATGAHTLSIGYGWRRLVRDTALPRSVRIAATATIAVMAVAVPVAVVARRLGGYALARALAWPTFTWLAVWSFTVMGLLAVDVVRLAARGGRRVARREGPLDPGRRTFLARLGGGAALTVAGAEVGLGVRSALGEHRVVDVPIVLPRLADALDGFTIVQLTDVHVGLTIGRDFIAEVVAKVNALEADVVAITGDLVDGPVDALRGDVAPLADLRARHGVFMVTGNHEYYSGVDGWLPVLADLGIRVLRNERVDLGGLDLAGIDDAMARQWGHGHGADLPRALAGRDPARPVVLLAHQPRQVHDAADAGVDLQLSGHTHGGQIWPWHHLAALQQGGLLAGHYHVGDTQLYVSRGVGYVGPPVRIAAPAEITRVVLRSPGRV